MEIGSHVVSPPMLSKRGSSLRKVSCAEDKLRYKGSFLLVSLERRYRAPMSLEHGGSCVLGGGLNCDTAAVF